MILSTYNIVKKYTTGWTGEVTALDNVSINFPENKVVTLLGETGSGKSTFSLICAALLKPDKGKVLYKVDDKILSEYESLLLGKDYEKADKLVKKFSVFDFPRKLLNNYRKSIGLMFQEAYQYLDDYLTVEQIIKEPILINKLNVNIEEIEESFGIKDIKDKYPFQLSDGQKQKVALARAFSYAKDFIILDEPTSNLDPISKREIIDTIKKYKATKTILLITHEANVAKELSDYVYIIYRGQIIEKGPSSSIFSSPKHPYAKQLISIGLKSVAYSGIVGEEPYYPFKIKGCIYHRSCPFSFKDCGWTPEEVFYDLSNLYYISRSKRLEGVALNDENRIVLFNTDVSEISSLISSHKNKYRSFLAVESIQKNESIVEIKIYPVQEIPLFEIGDIYTKCLLYRKIKT